MRFTVFPDKTGAIHGKHRVNALQGNVVHKLIIAALQKCGIHGKDRKQPVFCKPAGKRDGMLFGDADVKEAVGKARFKFGKARGQPHGRCHGAKARLLCREFTKELAEAVGIMLDFAAGRAGLHIEGCNTVKRCGVAFGKGIALALFRDDVQQHGAVDRLGSLQRVAQNVDAVAVDRAHITIAEVFKEIAFGIELILELGFQIVKFMYERLTHGGDLAERALGGGFEGIILRRGTDHGKIFGQRADIFRDRHLIVVEHKDMPCAAAPAVVERFIDHAARERAVADHGNHVMRGVLHLFCRCKAEPGRNGSAAVAGKEHIVFTFVRTAKTGKPARLAQRIKARIATGQQLMGIALMPHVKHDLVARGIENAM